MTAHIISKKVDAIDVVKLFAEATKSWDEFAKNLWNPMLQKALKAKDVKRLEEVKRGVQMGMDYAVRQKLDTEELAVFTLRLMRSIEKTEQTIWRSIEKNPLYDPNNKHLTRYLKDKREKDLALERFFKSQRW